VFAVSVMSADIDCTQYADFWEVVAEDGTLRYRRILEHSHTDENGTTDAGAPGNTFTREGGPVPVAGDEVVVVRAHLSNGGYHGRAMRGSALAGFLPAPDVGDDFAPELEAIDPQRESASSESAGSRGADRRELDRRGGGSEGRGRRERRVPPGPERRDAGRGGMLEPADAFVRPAQGARAPDAGRHAEDDLGVLDEPGERGAPPVSTQVGLPPQQTSSGARRAATAAKSSSRRGAQSALNRRRDTVRPPSGNVTSSPSPTSHASAQTWARLTCSAEANDTRGPARAPW
jgi:hypothetical protein